VRGAVRCFPAPIFAELFGGLIDNPSARRRWVDTHHGFTQWTTYQPAGRFWPFQWTEGGWLLALSLLLLTATVWLVRRRAV